MASPYITQAPATGTAFSADAREIERLRRMAEVLERDSAQPEGQMIGKHYVGPSWTQRLAQALNPAFASVQRGEADTREQKLSQRMNDTMRKDLQTYSELLSGKPAQSAPSMAPYVGNDPNNPMMVETQPAVAPDRNAAYAALLNSQHPALQGMGARMFAEAPELDARKAERTEDRTWRERQAQAAAEERRFLTQQQIDARREAAEQASADRRFIAGAINARKEQQNVPKLPTSALKMQQEELDAIGTASTINADMAALEKQIDNGELKLGPLDNLASRGKNFMGVSDQASRNFASLQATLEKMRNDSLRLNKGVQTEGDAQRAWNELVTNINDPKVLKKRLGEIQKINERAVGLRRMNIDHIRTNFGVPALDVSGHENLPPAIGGGDDPLGLRGK